MKHYLTVLRRLLRKYRGFPSILALAKDHAMFAEFYAACDNPHWLIWLAAIMPESWRVANHEALARLARVYAINAMNAVQPEIDACAETIAQWERGEKALVEAEAAASAAICAMEVVASAVRSVGLAERHPQTVTQHLERSARTTRGNDALKACQFREAFPDFARDFEAAFCGEEVE